MSEKKYQRLKFKNKINDEQIIKNINDKKGHYKQISQDYIYQKNKKIEPLIFIKNDKYNNTKKDNDENIIKEKIIKFGSLSPQPTIYNVETYQNEISKIKNIKKEKYNNFFTENNDPNLITGNTKEIKENEDDNKDREKLLFHIRDLIENKKTEKNKKIYSKENENKIDNLSNFSKYKNISNFNQENQNINNIEKNFFEEKNFSNKDLINITNKNNNTNENFASNKKINDINKNKVGVENKKNGKKKTNSEFGFKKLPIKEKKNKTKGILKNNKNNINSKLIKEKNKNKTNNNFKKEKNIPYLDNISLKITETNNKIEKKNKLLNQRNNNEKKDINKNDYEKNTVTLSHSILYRSPNSQLTKLLQKKEFPILSENNTTSKIYYKGKIKNMKYKKDLNFDKYNQNTNENYNYNNNLNNYFDENLNNNIILTEHNNTNININSKTNKGLIRTNNINNSDLRNKYKIFLLKKNKQKSCEIENQSAIQKKMNKELLERMNLIKKNNKNNFYQKYKENKIKLNGIKSYIGNNIASFDNLSNSNIILNSIGNNQNYARNSFNIENNNTFQTPSTENKKLGLYKKIIRQKPKFVKTDKKIGNKKGKNFETPSTIKVNRSKFLEKVKDKFYDNNKMITMNNFNSNLSHKNF